MEGSPSCFSALACVRSALASLSSTSGHRSRTRVMSPMNNPDPSLKHRVELPGEVAAQLSQMREDNRRLMVALQQERGKVDRLASVTKAMYDVMSKTIPVRAPWSLCCRAVLMARPRSACPVPD
ncbi:hypothetical protein NUW54_g8866 [Trametes sanguinea]|uniref:Uncharacterized protein n=1 Tax=Trametes sanguinea TaxID=158606 RepID=A0ACC1PBW7_9APHY|nr:hypothetical protein NUW54_g8866 [Trametes sanguinea]